MKSMQQWCMIFTTKTSKRAPVDAPFASAWRAATAAALGPRRLFARRSVLWLVLIHKFVIVRSALRIKALFATCALMSG